jgi:hypothetical protein
MPGESDKRNNAQADADAGPDGLTIKRILDALPRGEVKKDSRISAKQLPAPRTFTELYGVLFSAALLAAKARFRR